MIYDILFGIYMLNAILLIMHELDSVYWKEWDLFRLKGGLHFFLVLHVPFLFLILYGLVLVREQKTAGLVISAVLSICGLFAFFIHNYFIHKGRPEFNTVFSKGLLWFIGIVSPAQLVLTVRGFVP